MILIISDKSDKYADRVESILQENAAEYSRLNLDVESLRSTQIKFEDDAFIIEGPNCCFSTNEIEAVWNRGTRIEQFIDAGCTHDKSIFIWKEVWNKTLEKLFATLESTKWLNFYHDFYVGSQFRPYAISNYIGLKWPSYICSNDINYLNNFFESKKDRLLELMNQNCGVNKTGDCSEKCGDRFGTIAPSEKPLDGCPVANAAYGVRCTIVGKEYFVGKIKSNTNGDVRNTIINQSKNEIIQPPRSIKLKAIQIMNELNLTHGVFDFIVKDNDEWVFDALNPIGQYQWVEDIQDSDISLSVAKWLMINN